MLYFNALSQLLLKLSRVKQHKVQNVCNKPALDVLYGVFVI